METDDNVLARQGRHDRRGRFPPRIATPMVAALLSGSADGEVEAGFAAVRKGKEGRKDDGEMLAWSKVFIPI